MTTEGVGQAVTFDSTEGYIREILVPIDGGLVGYFRVGLSERPMMQLMWKRFAETMLIILQSVWWLRLWLRDMPGLFCAPFKLWRKPFVKSAAGITTFAFPSKRKTMSASWPRPSMS